MEPTQTTDVRRKNHRALKITALVVLVVVLILGLAPMLLSSSGGTRFLLGKINRTVAGQVGMDDFSIGWLSGIKLTNLTYQSDDGATQVKVGAVETHPRLAALVGGRVHMGRTRVDQPEVFLTLSALPKTVDSSAARPPSAKPQPFILPVHSIDLEVLNGSATVELVDADAQVRRVAFKNIATAIALNAPGKPSTLNLSADVDSGNAEAGSVHADGSVTPAKTGWSLEAADAQFTVTVEKLDLESLRPLLVLAGQDVQTGGVLDGTAELRLRHGTIETLKANAVITDFSQGIGAQKTTFAEPVTLSANLGMTDATLRIDDLNIRSDFFSVSCSGDTDTLDYTIQADLEPTQRFVQQFADLGEYALAGQLDVGGHIRLAETTAAATGSGTVKDFLVAKDGVEAPQTDVRLDFDVLMDNAARRLEVASATLSAAPGTLRVRHLSMPTGDQQAGAMTLAAQANLDLAGVWPYAQILADAPADMTLAGRLSAAVDATMQDQRIRIMTDDARVENLRVATTGSEPFVQEEVTLVADVSLDMAQQTLGIEAFDMRGKQGETLITVTQGQIEQSSADGVNRMDVDIEAEYDLQAISGIAGPYLPDGLKVEGKRKDRFVLSSQWPGDAPEKKMAHLNGAGGFGFDRAEYFGLNVGPTEMSVTIQNGIATMTLPETTVNEGTLRFAGTIDLTETPKFLRIEEPTAILENVQINDTVSAQLLTYLSPVFAGAVRTRGTANLTCRHLTLPLSGEHLDKMDIDGTVTIADIQLQAGQFLGQILTLMNQRQTVQMDLLPTHFQVQQGRISYDDMQINLGRYPLNFSGWLGLNKQMAMRVKLPLSMEFRPVQLADADVRRLEVPLGGTVDAPQIDTARLIERQAQDLIQQQLQRLFR